MNEKVDIEIFRRRLSVEIEGLTPLEISEIANTVNDKMTEISHNYPKIADGSKLAILAALEIAADLYKIRQAESTNKKALENTLERISESLEQSLAAAGEPAALEQERA